VQASRLLICCVGRARGLFRLWQGEGVEGLGWGLALAAEAGHFLRNGGSTRGDSIQMHRHTPFLCYCACKLLGTTDKFHTSVCSGNSLRICFVCACREMTWQWSHITSND
jgi:hypothetical protein